MDIETKHKAGPLIRAVVVLQLKLALSAFRDLVLIPLTLAAALADLIQLKTHAPSYFRQILKVGEHSDRWIDVWYSAHDSQQEPRSNVDALLTSVEQVVRDPQSGARRARVLKRWAERQVARARQRAAEARTKSLSDNKDENRDGTP